MGVSVRILAGISMSAAFIGCINDSSVEDAGTESPLALSTQSSCGGRSFWTIKKPGLGRDIAANTYNQANHSLIGTSTRSGGYSTWEWNGSSWSGTGGGATRTGNSRNVSWVVNSSGSVFKRNTSWDGGWQHIKGVSAKDIAGNALGDIWVVGTNNTVYQWMGGTTWSIKDPSNFYQADRISVDESQRMPWVVTKDKKVWRWVSDRWSNLGIENVSANDIAAVDFGRLFLISTTPTSGGNYAIKHRYGSCIEDVRDYSTNIVLEGVSIGAVNENEIWFTKANGDIYRAYQYP